MCDNCSNHNKSCGDPCGGSCNPARYGCDFQILANPFDESIWNVTICGATTKVKIPKLNETDTKLSVSFGSKSLIYNAEKHTDIITGDQLGSIINLTELRDVDAPNADSCDLLVFNPGCSDCGDGCKPRNARWRNYHIPDAGDCEVEPDEDGYYHILIKDGCGCIKECRLPVVPDGSSIINYVRDSVPDDPDFPWYYGCYNDTVNLYLSANFPQWFGKYDLEVTVNYGVQCVRPGAGMNVNWRSLVIPVVEGTQPNAMMMSSILQDDATTRDNNDTVMIPWGSKSMRGTFTFIVPKGKEASLHHEFRLRSKDSHAAYALNPTYDGVRVPDDIAGAVDKMPYNASRLHALQVIAKPARGIANFDPVKDADRDHLDAPIDVYPPLS